METKVNDYYILFLRFLKEYGIYQKYIKEMNIIGKYYIEDNFQGKLFNYLHFLSIENSKCFFNLLFFWGEWEKYCVLWEDVWYEYFFNKNKDFDEKRFFFERNCFESIKEVKMHFTICKTVIDNFKKKNGRKFI